MYRHPIVAIEGVDGTGKSTQASLLVDSLKNNYPDTEVVFCKYPGFTETGKKIREILIGDSDHPPLYTGNDEIARQFLFACDLKLTTGEVVIPALDQGNIVVTDRFLASNYVYSRFGCGLSKKDSLYFFEKILPDNLYGEIWFINILLDMSVELLQNRETKRDYGDSFPVDYYERVRNGYLELADINPDLWHVINADASVGEVAQNIYNIVSNRIEKTPGIIESGVGLEIFHAI